MRRQPLGWQDRGSPWLADARCVVAVQARPAEVVPARDAARDIAGGEAGARGRRAGGQVAGRPGGGRHGAAPVRGRRVDAVLPRLLLRAALTRRLQEARSGEAEGDAAGDHGPRLPAPEVLDVAKDRVAVGALQIVAERLGALGGLLGELRRLLLALLAQLFSH